MNHKRDSSRKLFRSIGGVKNEYIEEMLDDRAMRDVLRGEQMAQEVSNMEQIPRKKGIFKRRTLAVAASFAVCLVVAAVIVALHLGGGNTGGNNAERGTSGGENEAASNISQTNSSVENEAKSQSNENENMSETGTSEEDENGTTKYNEGEGSVKVLAEAVLPESAAGTNSSASEMSYQKSYHDFVNTTMKTFLKDSDGENLVYSPMSVYLALAMLAEVTDGTSRAQIFQLLGTNSVADTRGSARSLWLGNYVQSETVTSLLATSLWVDNAYSCDQNMIDTLCDTYYASSCYSGTMGTEVMNDTLRAWVNDMTGGLLTDQAGGIELSEETLLAIVTTIYYKISWLVSFSEEKTASGTFHAAGGDVTCEFMNRTGEMNYVDGDGYSAVYLPTSDREISDGGMWLILPDKDVSLDELLETFDIADLIGDAAAHTAENSEILECGESAMVTLSVPKFDVSSDMELSESLKALGVTDIFDKEIADFSTLSGDAASIVDGAIYLGQMQHAARVSIDENGIEGAAYTVEVVSADSLPELRVEFVLDRPFLFVITSGNAELFAGVVNQP